MKKLECVEGFAGDHCARSVTIPLRLDIWVKKFDLIIDFELTDGPFTEMLKNRKVSIILVVQWRIQNSPEGDTDPKSGGVNILF